MGCQIFAEVIGDREVMASTEKMRQEKQKVAKRMARTVQYHGVLYHGTYKLVRGKSVILII
jgi:hypothetical protein